VGDFGGTDPPDERSGPGPGYGKPPVQPFLEWLRALLNQKVARYKSPLHWLDHPGGCQYSDSCEITSMAFAPDGSKLAVTIKSKLDSSVGYAAAFDLSSMKPLGMLSLKGPATLVAINSAGSLLATNGNGKQVEVWDVATQRMVHALPAASARSLMFAPTGQLGVAGKVESTVWDLGSEKAVLTAAGSRIALSPSGSWLVAAASAGAIAVSEMGTGRALGSFAGIGRFYAGTVLSGDGRVLAYANLGGGSGKLFTAGAANPEDIEVTDHDPHGSVNAGLRAMAGTPDGIVFAGAGVVGVSTYAHPKPQFFATGDDYVNAIAVSPDGGLLVTGDTWLNFQLWELEEGSPQPR